MSTPAFIESFDVIVVGGGHAGVEAALASARLQAKTLLITHNLDTIAQMSCNPAIGGIGKTHLVKEIDALGGYMGEATDKSGIQFRILNARKGPAVRATRVQADRQLYRLAVKAKIEETPNLTVFQQPVEDLVLQSDKVVGVKTQAGIVFGAKKVVLTNGTFLGGLVHIGLEHYSGGRAGDAPCIGLAERLRELQLPVARLKTGTPPRLDHNSIDFSMMERQPGDTPRPVMSYLGKPEQHPRQVDCFIAYTNPLTHDIVREYIDQTPIYSGKISCGGPRYCPALEDKVTRFADKDRHQIFVEPEGLDTVEMYPNGISTSLPYRAQIKMVRSIKGFENARIMRPGYAIEYDFFDPRALQYSLETKAINGLYFAGQINGTTGYEEAAAQGLLAGTNAALAVFEKLPWIPRRDQAYLGVLVDDLIRMGAPEPYRMFTSRAEYRLLLRQDNADIRLTEIGRKLGLVCDERWNHFENKMTLLERERARLQSTWIRPNTVQAQQIQETTGQMLNKDISLEDLLRRPEVTIDQFAPLLEPSIASSDIAEQLEVQIKYQGYIERQAAEVLQLQQNEATSIPSDLDYGLVPSLSNEVREKLMREQPSTLGQASRISGVTPAALSLLLVYLKKTGLLNRSAIVGDQIIER